MPLLAPELLRSFFLSPSGCSADQVLSLAGLPPPEGVTLLGPSLCLPAQVPGWLITQAQTEGAHRGLHHYPRGTDLAEAEDLGGHRAQRLGVS